jgi:hypothetical protein
MILKAVLAGLGLACLPQDLVQENIRHITPAFAAVIEALRL